MKEVDQPMLDGAVEMDETYVGGKQRNPRRGKATTNKAVVIGIRQRNGDLRFFHAEDAPNVNDHLDVVIANPQDNRHFTTHGPRAKTKPHPTITVKLLSQMFKKYGVRSTQELDSARASEIKPKLVVQKSASGQ